MQILQRYVLQGPRQAFHPAGSQRQEIYLANLLKWRLPNFHYRRLYAAICGLSLMSTYLHFELRKPRTDSFGLRALKLIEGLLSSLKFAYVSLNWSRGFP